MDGAIAGKYRTKKEGMPSTNFTHKRPESPRGHAPYAASNTSNITTHSKIDSKLERANAYD